MTISRRDHYDKILENARQRLHSARVGERTRKEILDAYRRFLKVEDRRLRILHDSGASGIDVAYRRSRLLDVVLQNLVVDALEASGSEPTLGQPLTLVAVGGYGRGLLNPRSDVDLLFLTHTSGGKLRSDVAELISQILLMLYDVGFQVGHATRSIDESIQEANINNETKTSLIEARLLMGDQELFRRFQVQFRKQCVNGRVAEFVRHRLDDLKARHAKFSNTPFVQEPNVKQGCGGLRDYQNLIWMSYIKYNELDLGELEPLGILDRQELREIGKAYDFLHRVRNQMHYLEGRASDILTLRLQGRVARALGYTQKGILRQIEAFMRDYYLHTRNLFHRSQELMRRWRLEEKHVVPVSRRLGHFLARRKNTGNRLMN
jgi:[protein-PII] uridylyltransferase